MSFCDQVLNNFYCIGIGLICCGDDTGTLWLYNLPQCGKDGSAPAKGLVQPTTKLAWPELVKIPFNYLRSYLL